MPIDAELVRGLLRAQFPQWADLPLRPVRPGGWNNKSFRLGDDLVVRLPRAEPYAAQAEKEQAWLPRLAPLLPLPIPQPVGHGEPGEGYAWRWSVCRWIDGEALRDAAPVEPVRLATDLAGFLRNLQAIDAAEGPAAGAHNFGRGGPPALYDAQTRKAVDTLGDRIDASAALAVWAAALASAWQAPPAWLHGDVAPGNLIVRDGVLSAVIDWGVCGGGDPACDLAIGWTYFSGDGRRAFRDGVALDAATWARARGWTLWKALILMAGFSGDHPDAPDAPRVLHEVLRDPIAL